MKACKAAGVDVQFMGNVWGMDENAAKAAGDAADGVIYPLRTAVGWGGNAPGMKTVMEISKMSDQTGDVYRPVHYVAGVCTALYMKEAIDWAVKNGGPTATTSPRVSTRRLDSVPAGIESVSNPPPERQGPSRHAQGRSLSLQDIRRDRRRPERSHQKGPHQA